MKHEKVNEVSRSQKMKLKEVKKRIIKVGDLKGKNGFFLQFFVALFSSPDDRSSEFWQWSIMSC